MTTALKPFQSKMRDALSTRFQTLKAQYDAADRLVDKSVRNRLRLDHGAVMLQAPTGVGKTLIAVDTLQQFSSHDKVVWFWFVPFVGLIAQAQRTFQAEAPAVKLLSLESDRYAESLRPGGVYALSWQSVATITARRLLRETRDDGLSVDDLIAQARALGYRIGCVVDEAHHGFHRAGEASRFFSQVLKPDYALLMTATPRDEDAAHFSSKTGYKLGSPDDWATITRDQGVQAGLLKPEVKTVRFIARPGTESKMLDFERLALSQATELHKRIKQELEALGVGITPLMLVQVPNGDAAVDEAEQVLVKQLGFPQGAVRKHTAAEPDEHLAAIANDPSVEVLIFKMAVATGFDAPRAFTLAALRGVRDREFGVQVVGRIMRVHRLLQGRDDIPLVLKNGYVFLANLEDQEGLRTAAELINTLKEQEPQLGQQTVLTLEVGVSEADISVATTSSAAAVHLDANGAQTTGPEATAPLAINGQEPADAGTSADDASVGQPVSAEVVEEVKQLIQDLKGRSQQDWLAPAQTSADGSTTPEPVATNPPATSTAARTSLTELLSKSSTPRRYPRRATAPTTLRTERLPTLPDNFEEQVVNLIDFTPVLGDRDRTGTQLTQRTEALFDEADAPVDEQILAQLSVSGIAQRAKQVALPFNDVDERDFLRRLEERFKQALTRQGIAVPTDSETLRKQLDLVLVRNPKLVRDAHKRVRAGLIQVAEVSLPNEVVSPAALPRSAKNVYGVYPPGLNTDERELSQSLDTDPDVAWWHRNPSEQPSSIGLWAWSGGVQGFYPDFVVCVNGRAHSDGQALVEVKGEHLQEEEKAKAGALARYHGRVFMVGKQDDGEGFYILRLENNQLQVEGVFEVQRLRTNV